MFGLDISNKITQIYLCSFIISKRKIVNNELGDYEKQLHSHKNVNIQLITKPH